MFIYLASPCDIRDLRGLTRDWTHDPCIESHQQSPPQKTNEQSIRLFLSNFFFSHGTYPLPGCPDGAVVNIRLPTQETWVGSLGRGIPRRGKWQRHSTILAWEVPWTEEPGGCSPWGHKDSDTTEQLSTHAPSLPLFISSFSESDGVYVKGVLYSFHPFQASLCSLNSSLQNKDYIQTGIARAHCS